MHFKLFRKSRDVTMSVSYISISCNFIIKYYVNRKITSLDIYKINMTSGQAFYCTNEKGKSEKDFFFCCNYRSYPCHTSTSDREKHGKVRQHWRKKRKKTSVLIKRAKSDSYLTYGQSCKT
jgi:hypothetical protein